MFWCVCFSLLKTLVEASNVNRFTVKVNFPASTRTRVAAPSGAPSVFRRTARTLVLSGAAQMAECCPNKLHQHHTLTEHQSSSHSVLPVCLFFKHPSPMNPLLCIRLSSSATPGKNTWLKMSRWMPHSGIYSSYSGLHFGCITLSHAVSLQITPTSCVFSIVASWEVSAIGHPVVLPLSVCEELLGVMEESNSTLPASMRCMRSYEVRGLLIIHIFIVFVKLLFSNIAATYFCSVHLQHLYSDRRDSIFNHTLIAFVILSFSLTARFSDYVGHKKVFSLFSALFQLLCS